MEMFLTGNDEDCEENGEDCEENDDEEK